MIMSEISNEDEPKTFEWVQEEPEFCEEIRRLNERSEEFRPRTPNKRDRRLIRLARRDGARIDTETKDEPEAEPRCVELRGTWDGEGKVFQTVFPYDVHNERELVGQWFIVGESIRRVTGIELFAHKPPWRKGEQCGVKFAR